MAAVAKYLYRLRYTQTGLQGSVKEGFAAREAYFRNIVGGLGGTTEAAYWAYGDVDIFIIVDLPNAEAATGLSLAIASGGAFGVTTTPLLTAADMDAGVRVMPSYRAPGT
jgi:uncharacterized protein with GYD domain